MYVTYQDLIQIGILIVALVNLVYQIYKGKKK
ncbi:putative holin-like toxin [Parablautia muri]|nr:putative holin-like toxin [Parablautia muri]